MKKRIPSFFSGFLTAVLLLALTTTALAASGKVSYNFANVALDGETRIAAGKDITAANGQQIPGSILYTDAAGGKTNYLPIRTISELLGVEIGYDSAAKTILLGGQSGTAPAAQARWSKTVDGNRVTYTSAETESTYDTAPLYRPAWQAEGWGLSSLTTDGRGVHSAYWRYLDGSGNTVSLTCANPGGGSFGFQPGLEDSVKNRRQVTVQGCPADLYMDIESCYLVWENSDGVLFTMRGPDEETLRQVAESIRPCAKEAPEYQLSWLPEGYKQLERSALGDTVYASWIRSGMSLTWMQSAESLALPEGTPETVSVNGVKARYWAAKEPYEESPVEVNGEPLEEDTTSLGGVTITSGVVHGARSEDVNTLVWSRDGVNFRLQGALDRETLVRIAEHVTLKK
ncbi:DUF4367 domain-containing protein [uncultured Dysosmobacter sp.]|uniref:DUF4367 domain-containing protein n=1 Tax=uncultured Dysosmobacter sp. TaxID=2591384 RepID=UPI002634232E|nr:DUF4367 domain-containing protein [uncultured Dysosmobacter sp.]